MNSQEQNSQEQGSASFGYVDIHCHILAGLDDGPGSIEGSLEMARMAASDGTSVIIATPHTRVGTYENPPEQVAAACEKLRAALEQERIPLQILPGNELHIHRDAVATLRKREAYTLADGNRYVLLEIPFSGLRPYIREVIQEMLDEGITPIIPHPERTDEICENPFLVEKWVRMGALTQITAGSLLDRFGEKSKECAGILIRNGLAHLIASDGHNVSHRKPVLSEAYRVVQSEFGSDVHGQFLRQARMVAGLLPE